MAETKFVINDSKTGKSYQKALEDSTLVGKKIGETITGDFLDLEGYELQVTGGSDSAGFPMRKEIEGSGRKRSLFTGGVGVKVKRAGIRQRKTVCKNTISDKTVQVNLKVTKYGSKKLEELFPKKEEEKPKAE